MKKIVLAFMAFVCSLSAMAQYSSGGFELDKSNLYYGVRVGLSASTITGDFTDNVLYDMGTKAGMTLGGVVGLRVSPVTPLFLESGLYFTQRGTRRDNKNKISLDYLEIPLLIKYGVRATEDIAVLPFLGPYFSYAVGGKTIIEGTKQSSFKDGNFKHADVGIKIGCGVEYNMLYLETGYQFGVANISDTDFAKHTGAFMLNFGVNF